MGAVQLLWARSGGRAGCRDGSSGVTYGLRLSPASFSLLANDTAVFHFLLFPWSMLRVKWTNDSGSRRELERGTEGVQSVPKHPGQTGRQILGDGALSLE